VFEIKNTGTVAAPIYASAPTVLVNFNGTNGASPRGIIADANGDLFGTTYQGGANPNDGTVFEIKNTGTVAAPIYASTPTTLINFDGIDGANPVAGLIADANDDLFGTTYGGGVANNGFSNGGTAFEISFVAASAPTITGTISGQTTTKEAPLDPFAKATIGDANPGATDRLTITLSGAGGTLADGAGFSGLKTSVGGAYSLSGTASAITSELDALVFTPKAGAPNTSSTTRFTLGDRSSASATAVADNRTSVIDRDPTGAPTIAGTVSGQTTTSEAAVKPFAHATVGDANAGATDTLTVTLSGSGGTLADGAGFSGLKTSGGGVYTLTGTASAITSELDALVFTPKAAWPNPSATATFTLSDVSSAYATPAVDSTTTVIDNDPSGAISVSAAYLAANIDGINAASQVTSITLTDSGIPQLNLTNAQATGDTAALNKITNEAFELLAPGLASTYYVGGNGATGPALPLTVSNSGVVERAKSNVGLTGSSDTVTMGAGSNLTINGSNDAISATTGDRITISAGTGETITGSDFTVTAATGTALAVGGNGVSGATDNITDSGASVTVQAASRVILIGSNDSVTMGAGSHLIISGSGDTISATTGDGILLNSGTGDTASGSGFTINSGAGTGFTIVGTGDVVYAGLNDAITDSGSSTTFKINANVGNLAISSFDTGGIIDLLSGAGGYTSASQAFASLTSDGAGGSKLSLGTDGSIDFAHVAPSSLHASNFKIG
jgi:hypothetical protein